MCPKCKSKNIIPVIKCYIEKNIYDLQCNNCGYLGMIEEFDAECLTKDIEEPKVIDDYILAHLNKQKKRGF